MDYQIKKPRSLRSEDDGGWNGNNTHKHFRVNGADPGERASNGKSRKKHNKLICKRSPDKEHHFEVECDWFVSYRERMVNVCSFCGFKGSSFSVWIGPKPDWILNLEKMFGREWI